MQTILVDYARAPVTSEMLARKNAREALRLPGEYPIPAANVGRNHPDYGMTPVEHENAKRLRQEAMAKSTTGELTKMPRRFGK